MRRLLLLFSVVLLAGAMTACDTFVSEVDTPKDSDPEETFTTPQDINFLANGVKTQGANATAFLSVTSGLLSDQLRFGRNADATFPTFAAPDQGLPTPLNTSVGDATRSLGEYRRLADNLLRAAERPEEYPPSAPITEQEAKFIGTFHGAIARYYYATYVGLNPREGGGVIDESAFIPSPAMYDSARVKFNRALELAPTAKDAKNVRSVHARSALYAGTQFDDVPGYDDALQRAAELASDGLKPGDAPFDAKFSVQAPNYWWDQAGPGRFQIVAMDNQLDGLVAGSHKDLAQIRSFKEVLANNPNEASRIPFVPIPLGGGATELGQLKYAVENTPTPIISWEEMHLIRAELELLGYSTGSTSALDLVNEVRSDGTLPGRGIDEVFGATLNRNEPFNLPALDNINMERLAVERDRTLFGQGQRLPDQRRLDAVDWHLKETIQGQTTWQYLPLTSQERDNNPNL
jgi:hypothetical protein